MIFLKRKKAKDKTQKQKTDKCIHALEFDNNETTLIPIKVYKMVDPLVRYYRCKTCGKIFQTTGDNKELKGM